MFQRHTSMSWLLRSAFSTTRALTLIFCFCQASRCLWQGILEQQIQFYFSSSVVAKLIDTGDFSQVYLINPLFFKFDRCMTTYWMFIISFLATLV